MNTLSFIKKFVFLLFLLQDSFIGFSQYIEDLNVIPVSPEAYALEQSINNPVNYNTGKPIIEIPLHEYKIGDKTFPLKLTYSAGIKVNQTSGWVGLGWNLEAAPMVMRSVQGEADEDGSKYTPYINSKMNLHEEFNLVGGILPNDEPLPTGCEEPDRFYYNLLDKRGGFMFQAHSVESEQTGDFIQLPHKGLKIAYTATSTINGFTITDIDGTIYEFGGLGHGIEYGRKPGSNTEAIPTCWKATKIISPNNDWEVHYDYKEPQLTPNSMSLYEDYTYSFLDLYRLFFKKEAMMGSEYRLYKYEHCVSGDVDQIEFINDEWIQTGDLFYTNKNTTWASKNPLQGITYYKKDEHGELHPIWAMVFNSNITQLNNILIYNQNDEIVKRITLNQTNFSNQDDPQYSLRKKLDKVTISPNVGDGKDYVFDYYHNIGNLGTGGELRFDSKKVDYLGYFNNKNNSELVSSNLCLEYNPDDCSCANLEHGTNGVRVGTADRNAYTYTSDYQGNLVTSSFGHLFSLSRITYPTKGYTTYEYEPHELYPGYYISSPSAGVRIKRILNFDSNDELISNKHYTYGNPYNFDHHGLGYPMNLITFDGGKQYTENYSRDNGHVGPEYMTRTFKGHTTTNFTGSDGPEVVYDKVSEYSFNDKYLPAEINSETCNGKIEYFFYVGDRGYMSNNDGAQLPDKNYYAKLFNKSEWDGIPLANNMGIDVNNYNLKEKKTFKFDNTANDFIEIKKEEYTYTSASDISFGTTESKRWYLYGAPNCYLDPLDTYNQLIYCENYRSDHYRTIDNTITSYGEYKLSHEKVTDYLGTNSIVSETYYSYENNEHLQPTKIWTFNSEGKRKNVHYSYSGDFCCDIFSKIKSRNMLNLPVETYTSDFEWEKCLDANGDFIPCGNVFSGNIITYKENEYSHIVRDENFLLETKSPIAYEVFKPFDGKVMEPNYQKKAKYDEFDAFGNLLQYHLEKGINVSYYWGYKKEYPVMIAENSTYSSVELAIENSLNSIAVEDFDGFLNSLNDLTSDWAKNLLHAFVTILYSQSGLENAIISFYTYDPLIGITSQTDPNGKTTYYEYDDFGRLIYIKDDEGKVLQRYEYNYAK